MSIIGRSVYVCKKQKNVRMRNLTIMASRMFFFISSIFWRFSRSLNPLTCKILICLTIVDFPDSPAPKSNNRCVARYTCLSFWSCLLIWSLILFCDLVSSAAGVESLLPKQPMAAREDHQQPAPFSAAPGPHSGPVATVAVVVSGPLTPGASSLPAPCCVAVPGVVFNASEGLDLIERPSHR